MSLKDYVLSDSVPVFTISCADCGDCVMEYAEEIKTEEKFESQLKRDGWKEIEGQPYCNGCAATVLDALKKL